MEGTGESRKLTVAFLWNCPNYFCLLKNLEETNGRIGVGASASCLCADGADFFM